MIEHDSMLRGLSMIHGPGMLSVREAEYLYDFASSFSRPATWVELGSWCGRSYWATGCGLPKGSRIVSVDEFSGQIPAAEGSDAIVQYAHPKLQRLMFGAVQCTLREMRPDVRFECIAARTNSAAELWVDQDHRQIDALLVDAGHDYASVKSDIQNWMPFVDRTRGVVIVHDYTDPHPGVLRAVNEAFGFSRVKCPARTRFAVADPAWAA